MTRDVAMNILGVIDNTDTPEFETVRMIKQNGAVVVHEQWREAMLEAGWKADGAATDTEMLTTPHLRRWSLLVDGQRKPLLDLENETLEPEWGNDEEE